MHCILRAILSPRRLPPLLALLLLLALFGRPAAPVSADGELGVSVREVTVDDSSLVQFLAKVVDENGRPLRLNESSFSVTSAGQGIPVTGVQTVTDAAVGISALLVIDTSGSMAGTPLVDARNAAAQYIQSLQPNDEVGVAAFSTATNVIAEFGSDFAAAEAQLANLTAVGDTALFAAVNDSANTMAARPAARRVVILISDGEDTSSSVGREAALEAAVASGTPFYVVGLGPTIDTAFLQAVADATGGAFFAAPSSDQLAALFEEIAELLRSEYVVTVDFAGTGLGGQASAIVLAENAGKNGAVTINFALPEIPVPPQPRPADQPVLIPQPVQLPAPPPREGESNTALIALVAVSVSAGVLGWAIARKHFKPKPVTYVFDGAPVLLPRDAAAPAAVRNAPPALLRLDSGEELPLNGIATLGADPENTFQLPLSRADFGSAELRVWFSGQRYVIRDAAHRARMRVNGRTVSWSFLNDGDEIDVRGLKLRFAMPAEVPSPAET
jgi:VWFA-related protein